MVRTLTAGLVREASYRFRACFHSRWGGYLALLLLIGLVGGVAMGAVAGARRTQSSFPVYLASTNPSDVQAFTEFDPDHGHRVLAERRPRHRPAALRQACRGRHRVRPHPQPLGKAQPWRRPRRDTARLRGQPERGVLTRSGHWSRAGWSTRRAATSSSCRPAAPPRRAARRVDLAPGVLHRRPGELADVRRLSHGQAPPVDQVEAGRHRRGRPRSSRTTTPHSATSRRHHPGADPAAGDMLRLLLVCGLAARRRDPARGGRGLGDREARARTRPGRGGQTNAPTGRQGGTGHPARIDRLRGIRAHRRPGRPVDLRPGRRPPGARATRTTARCSGRSGPGPS